jgi:uncharacterized protein (TIGR03067 family)
MLKRTLTLVAIAALAGSVAFAQGATQSGAAKPDTAKSKTLTALQGAWLITMANGQDRTGQAEMVVTITDDKYVQTVSGQVIEKGTMKFDDAKKPITIDVVIVEGSDAGKVQLGVFEFISATEVRGKLSGPGEPTRATDFTPAEGTFAFTAVKKK